ncbi:MAG: putative Fe-S oxidoreductase [Firmicutes bacterium]|nr:putative Fe-S oxidoreductase [Bacillota bacterium]
MEIVKVDKANSFVARFNTESGFYIRSGVIKNGIDTNVDPFMASFPELIDVGIMGSCAHATQCTVGCYQGGTNNQKSDMKLENYKSIIDQCEGKVFQIALGGHGDPNKHENFAQILKYTRSKNIVPNYTTSGFNLTDEEVRLTKEYCGAVAVSWYRQNYTFRALNSFLDAGCTTNIHYVLSNESINEAIDILSGKYKFREFNAIIFLLHKPVGCGSKEAILHIDYPRLNEFFGLVAKKHQFKIGFDSCTIPGLVNYADINFDTVDTCEGARYSMYISPDMIAVPCSFDQSHNYSVDLNLFTIQDAWDSGSFDEFRSHMKTNCTVCDKHEICKSGCPLERGIVLCNRKVRTV